MSDKKLLDEVDNVVSDMLDGLFLVNSRISHLAVHNVVIRSDFTPGENVAVISGGGSGHEPAWAGYVGPGLLTASVCGGVFASPSAESVLVAIRASASKEKGCLVLVMNYTGDRLNFGLAIERARKEGYKAEMVVVADDCALPKDKGITGRRGVAGTVLVAKVACAAAEAGLDLDAVAMEARRAAERVSSLGVTLMPCTLPGQLTNMRLGPDEMEIGVGIHGEPGVGKTSLDTASNVVDKILDRILGDDGHESSYLPIQKQERVVLLANNLGGTTMMEMLVVARSAILSLRNKWNLVVERVYLGHFMTSLEMRGVSLSIFYADDRILELLDAPCDAMAWVATQYLAMPPRLEAITDLQSGEAEVQHHDEEGRQGASKRLKLHDEVSIKLSNATRMAAERILAMESQLTQWDTVAGDGDCGITFARGARNVLASLENQDIPLLNFSSFFDKLGKIVGASMGGTSGALLEIFFTACATTASHREESEPIESFLPSVMLAGTAAVKFYGGADLGMRTMMDALLPFCAEIEPEKSDSSFEKAVGAAKKGAQSTQGMDAKAGRANYVKGASAVPDPGAMAVASILEAIYEAWSSK